MSPLRAEFERCQAKQAYLSQMLAENAAVLIRLAHLHERDQGLLNAYHCRICGDWHLTSKKAPRKAPP